MKPYRVALVGTGQSVGNHLSAIRHVGARAELVAAVDLDEARVRTFAQENSVPNVYTDVKTMLAREKPDLVHIVTPPATHAPLTLTCLGAGAWVYCEKPLCASLTEFDAITRAEHESGCYVSTVFQWRFGSAAKHLKMLIEKEALGRPLVGVCNTLWYRNAEYYAVPWRGKWASEIGGPTATLGIHLMDLCLWLLGDWAEVRAMMDTLDRDIEVEDVSMALVRFESGALATLTNSALSPRQESYLRLDFQRATAEVSALYRYSNADWRVTLPDGVDDPEALASWGALERDISGRHEMQLAEILASMDKGVRPPVSGTEARRILEFMTALYKSALTDESVRRGSVGPDDPFYAAMNGTPVTPV